MRRYIMNTVQNKSSVPFYKRGYSGKHLVVLRIRILLCMIILFLALASQKISGQGVGISESSIIPDGSSILELRSSLRGFLAPRMSTGERLLITSPAQGLLVYDTTTQSFWYFENGWKAIASGALGASNQLLGMNGAGNANEYKTLLGTANQISVFHAPGSITLSTPQDIAVTSSPVFAGLTLTNPLTVPNGGTGLSSGLSGGIPYFNSNTTMASSAVLTANGVVIGGGSGLAPATIGVGAANTVLRGTGGVPAFGQIVNGDITNGTIDLRSKVFNVLPIANGGTNSGVALSGQTIMISNGGSIVQGQAGTTSTVLHGNSGGAPAYGQVVNVDIADGAVTTDKILNANVTPIKIAPGASNQVLVTDGTGAVAWINKDAFGAIADQVTIGGTGTTLDPFYVLDLGITTAKLADGAVTSLKIADGTIADVDVSALAAIAGSKIVPDFVGQNIVTTGTLNAGNSTLGTLSAGATTLGTLSATATSVTDLTATGVVTLGDDAIQANEIENGAVTTDKILNANVTPIKIAPGAVDQVLVTDGTGAVAWINKDAFGAIADQVTIGGTGTTLDPFYVLDLGITTAKLADGAVTSLKIADGTIADVDVSALAAIAGSKIVPDFVGQNIVTTGTLNAGNSTLGTLSAGATTLGTLSATATSVTDLTATGVVTLGDDAIQANEIENGAVTTDKILNANVTPIKIAPGAVDQVLVTDGTGAVAWINKDAFGAIADQVTIGGTGTTLDPFYVLDLGITTAKLADGAVTSLKIADGTIADVDVSALAAIAGSKIVPDFVGQNIVTTGTLNAGNSTLGTLSAGATTLGTLSATSTSVTILPPQE